MAEGIAGPQTGGGCFNGAAPVQARMGAVSQAVLVEAASFNGAAPVQARMGTDWACARRSMPASMGPRRFRRGWASRDQQPRKKGTCFNGAAPVQARMACF